MPNDTMRRVFRKWNGTPSWTIMPYASGRGTLPEAGVPESVPFVGPLLELVGVILGRLARNLCRLLGILLWWVV